MEIFKYGATYAADSKIKICCGDFPNSKLSEFMRCMCKNEAESTSGY